MIPIYNPFWPWQKAMLEAWFNIADAMFTSAPPARNAVRNVVYIDFKKRKAL